VWAILATYSRSKAKFKTPSEFQGIYWYNFYWIRSRSYSEITAVAVFKKLISLFCIYTLFKFKNVVAGQLVCRSMAILHGRYTNNWLGEGDKRVLPDCGPTKTGSRRLGFLTWTEYRHIFISLFNIYRWLGICICTWLY